MSAAGSLVVGESGERLAEMLALIDQSDSVELKLTVPESHQRSTAMALGMDPLQAQMRMVVFFDTPELTLDKHGVVVRARRVQNKGDDSVVKLRPVVPSELPAKLRRSAALPRRGRRHARRLCLLRHAEGRAGADRRARRHRRKAPRQEALQSRAACVLHRRMRRRA